MKKLLKLQKKSNRRGQQGNVLVIFMLAMSISTLAVYSFYYSRGTSFIANSVLQSTASNIQLMQSNLVSVVSDSAAWTETYKSAANGNLFRCMTDATFECPRGTFPLVIMDGLGGRFYDGSAGTTGFTNGAKVCTEYGSHDSACQLRYDITWSPECPPNGSCIMPAVVIYMNLNVSHYAGAYRINPVPYKYILRVN